MTMPTAATGDTTRLLNRRKTGGNLLLTALAHMRSKQMQKRSDGAHCRDLPLIT